MRAPEVFQGRPCTHASQVWACAALLLVWMEPSILGRSGHNRGTLFHNSWSIAKLRRLFPNWNGPPLKGHRRAAEFQVADEFIKELPPMIGGILSLEDEMQKMGLLPELEDMLRFLFVTDPDARPSAAQVLESDQLRALKKALSCMG